jgi:hypothetical protein
MRLLVILCLLCTVGCAVRSYLPDPPARTVLTAALRDEKPPLYRDADGCHLFVRFKSGKNGQPLDVPMQWCADAAIYVAAETALKAEPKEPAK